MNPQDEFQRMRQAMDAMVQRVLRQASGVGPGWAPPMDIYETRDAIEVVVEVGGLRREDLRVSWENETLRISGRRERLVPAGVTRYHQLEMDHGTFVREVTLNLPVAWDRIEASYRDGILRVVIPKRVTAPRTVKISLAEADEASQQEEA